MYNDLESPSLKVEFALVLRIVLQFGLFEDRGNVITDLAAL
jgi:hypothetical protein